MQKVKKEEQKKDLLDTTKIDDYIRLVEIQYMYTEYYHKVHELLCEIKDVLNKQDFKAYKCK